MQPAESKASGEAPSLSTPPAPALDSAMSDIAVKREPSGTASPITNGYTVNDVGAIAQSIEPALNFETPDESKAPDSEQDRDKSLADFRGDQADQLPTNGVKKKSAKTGRVIARPKKAKPKNSKKATSRPSKAAGANGARQFQAAPTSDSLQGEDEDEDDDDDGEGDVFCICRGPDDHTWMIGCDGECEDWFHGRCVSIDQKDADLIDKYICELARQQLEARLTVSGPNCYIKGTRQTTWKPMCRLDGCRKPARVHDPSPSKFCSEAHGVEFFKRIVAQKTRRSDGPPPSKRSKVDKPGPESNQTHLYGGLLSSSEAKALVDGSEKSQQFNELGSSVLPATNGAESRRQDEDRGPTVTEVNEQTCTPEEGTHLRQVLDDAANTRHSLEVLMDKEKLLKIVRSQAAQKNAEVGGGSGDMKKKETFREVCGYDSRLAWNEEEFDVWRTSDEGRQALKTEVLPPPAANAAATDLDGDSAMVDEPVDEAEERREGVCHRKRCERHKTWWKIHNQNILHERNECYHKLEKLGDEARGIQERAILKRREEEANKAAP